MMKTYFLWALFWRSLNVAEIPSNLSKIITQFISIVITEDATFSPLEREVSCVVFVLWCVSGIGVSLRLEEVPAQYSHAVAGNR